ncbi:hypothetical protein VTN77DRAFT_8326 [Rasamsonia byssochlamydoides]|uniref:uncharacterized protein n=1 Tax=Rasamsonia byssochlamydoides TaxID=89139 RepID=UPI00374280DB
MLIDGEKWACEACVRGHRVSSCRHHDRPLIRINKKGRPFSVCRLCRGPCKDREEHSKLNSRDKKSDGESDAKSSGKVFKKAVRRRVQPASFARIAPQPAPLPSPTEQSNPSHQYPTYSNPQPSSLPLPPSSTASFRAPAFPAASPAAPGYDLLSQQSHPMPGPVATYASVTTAPMGYTYVTLPAMEDPVLQQSSSYPFQFPDDSLFPEHPSSLSDNGFVPDSTLAGFEDVDALPEDWSTFFWSQ